MIVPATDVEALVENCRVLREAARRPADLVSGRLIAKYGTAMAELILSEAMLKVCSIGEDVPSISQIWVLDKNGPGEHLNTSALAQAAASARGE